MFILCNILILNHLSIFIIFLEILKDLSSSQIAAIFFLHIFQFFQEAAEGPTFAAPNAELERLFPVPEQPSKIIKLKPGKIKKILPKTIFYYKK